MAYRRYKRRLLRRTRKRRGYRRNRMMGMNKMMLYKRISRGSTVYSYKQTYSGGTISGSDLVENAGALQFSLSTLPQATTFTALYDQYMITKVVVKFLPKINQTVVSYDSASPNIAFFPYFYTVVDYDDANAPTSIDELLQYQSLKFTLATRPHKHVLTPSVASAVYNGAFTGFANDKYKWIDSASPNVQHYGVKWYLPELPSGYDGLEVYNVYVTMYVKFRNVR